jgi:hypothetical protein
MFPSSGFIREWYNLEVWRFLTMVRKTVLLESVRRLNYKIIKLHRFGSWFLLPFSGRKGGKRRESLSVGPAC